MIRLTNLISWRIFLIRIELIVFKFIDNRLTEPFSLNLPLSPGFRGRSLGEAPLRDSDQYYALLRDLCDPLSGSDPLSAALSERSGRETITECTGLSPPLHSLVESLRLIH